MAKRRKKEEEEEPDFEMPDFDREEYMKNEIKKGKTTLVSVALAPVFSIVSFYVFNLTEEWTVGLFAGLLGIAILKPVYDGLGLEVEELDTKGWAKNFGVYFLTLLAVWVLLMNPPFSDFADPRLNKLDVEIREGPVFDIEDNVGSITSNLTAENLSTHLRAEYEQNGYPLSQNISISEVRQGEEWYLSDGNRGYRHQIKKVEGDRLSIYGRELVDFDNIGTAEAYNRTYNVTFRAKITSNTEIKEDSVYISVDGGNKSRMKKDPDREHYYFRTYEKPGRDTPYKVEIEMEDVNGNYHKEILEINIPPHE